MQNRTTGEQSEQIGARSRLSDDTKLPRILTPASHHHQSQNQSQSNERVHLNTQRNIHCYVVTTSELTALNVASSLITAILSFQWITALIALVVVIVEPRFTHTAITVTALVSLGGQVGVLIAQRWRNSILKTIKSGVGNENAS